MSDQRIGRHIRIYEWDEVNLEDENTPHEPVETVKAAPVEKKAAQDAPKGLSALLKKKLF